MPFDLASAKPVDSPAGGFDLTSAKPVGPVGMDTGQDTSSKEAFLASGQKPVKDEGSTWITPGELAAGPGGILAAGGRAVGRGVETILNTDINLPVLGRGNLGQVLQGMGPPESFGSRAATPVQTLKNVERKPPVPKVEPSVAPKSGAGAESAVNELQRQRNVAEGVDKPANLAGMGAHEAAVLERDKVTTPLRQTAFREGGRVDTAPVTKMLDELTAKNPDPKVRAALDGVRDVIANATTASKNAALPQAGARVTPADLKKMQGQAQGMNTAMADEVRQSINRLLDKTGDGALDAHTKQLLMQVRDKLVEGTSPAYKKYLEEYTRLSKPIDEFTAAGGAAGKVTTDKAAFHLLNPADKQNMLTAAFKSDTPGRALSELVRDTAHHPEAAQGVRAAYTEWLTHVDDTVKMLPTAGGLTKRWEQTRAAVKSSGLMDETHIKAMDVIMDDVRDAASKTGVKKAWASTAGFLFGNTVGHPIVAAHAARDLIGGTKSEVTQKALEAAMMKIAATPNGAKALAAAPTPKNIETVRAMLPTDVAAALAPVAAREEQSRRRRDPYSMQPSF